MLKQEIGSILEKADYEYSEYSGCFDIIARKSEILLLKALENVDSVQAEQANNMKILAGALAASPAIIGMWTRRERLCNDIVYDRFDIPTFTPQTLENILVKDARPLIYRFRGGFFSEINPEKLAAGRCEMGLSQSQLAGKARVTKKNIYEHEKKSMLARADTVKRLEKLVGSISEPIRFWDADFTGVQGVPKGRFEKEVSEDLVRIGFDTNFVYQSPFNIIAEAGGRKRFLLLSDAEENSRLVVRNEKRLAGFAEVADKPVLVITKSRIDIELPAVEEKELKTMTKREIIRTVKGW